MSFFFSQGYPDAVDVDFTNAIKAVEKVGKEVMLEEALKLQALAEDILLRDAVDPTGKLAEETLIMISQFKEGGYLIYPQPAGHYTRYYAYFVEYGTEKMDPIPFLRPAIKKRKRAIRYNYQNRLMREFPPVAI